MNAGRALRAFIFQRVAQHEQAKTGRNLRQSPHERRQARIVFGIGDFQMATPVRETPTLTGDDARRFEERMKEAETRRVSDDERARIMESLARFHVANTYKPLDVMKSELETARKIFWLLKHDHVFLSCYNETEKTWDDGAYPAINCNDVFTAGADAELLRAEDLDAYIEAVKRWPNAGSYAWCAVKRSAKPWTLCTDDEWTAEYEAAISGITEMLNKSIRSEARND